MDLNKTAAELGRDIDRGKIDPRDLAEAYLAAIESHPDRDTIYARLTVERARSEASVASERAKSGSRKGPLDGVPVSWKDLYDTAGVATESGASLLKGRTPDADALVLRRATAAGTVCLGKTHQTEFAFSGLGINPKTATPPNKLMPGHLPGGSSSGAAASITHGLAPIAIGSDTGGSVRIPACWNSLVGFKPTHDVLPLTGVVPLCVGFDTVGPLARTVEDATLVFAAMGGASVDLAAQPAASDLRFARVGTAAMDGCDDAVVRAYESGIARLARAGVTFTGIEPHEFDEAVGLGAKLFPFEAWQQWGEPISANPGVMFPPIEARFRQGEHVKRSEYDAAWKKLRDLRESFFNRFADFDGFVWPTLAGLPAKIADLIDDPEAFTSKNLLTLRNTRHVNLMGGCAITLPLPEACIGFQIMAPPHHDTRLLQMAAALERVVNP